jgi:Flp pilus assembly protein TadG
MKGRFAMRRIIACRQGTAAIELAFVLPVLALLTLRTLEFGRAMGTKQTMQFAVEEAARSAVADSTLTNTAIASLVGSDLVGLQGVAPTVVATSTAAQVSITASYAFTFLVPQLLPFGPLTLTAQCVLPR